MKRLKRNLPYWEQLLSGYNKAGSREQGAGVMVNGSRLSVNSMSNIMK
jgi:hypothetical protein